MPLPAVRLPARFPNAGQALLVTMAMLAAQAVIGMVALGVGYLVTDGPEEALKFLLNPWVLAVSNIVAMGGTLVVVLRRTHEPVIPFLRLRPIRVNLLPAMILTCVGLVLVLSEVDNLILELVRLTPKLQGGLDLDWLDVPGNPLACFVLLVVVAPLTEEYLFRGLMLRGLLTRHRAFVAILITATLFGLMHANLRQFVLGIVIGSVFGWWYWRTASLAPCLLGHALFNFFAFLGALWPSAIPGFSAGTGTVLEHQPWWLTLSGIVVASAGIWRFKQLVDLQPSPWPAAPPPPAEPPLLDLVPPPLASSAEAPVRLVEPPPS